MSDASFWDKTARKYAASKIADMGGYQETLARTRSYLHADDNLLEVGCGTGSTALILAPHVRQMTATDFSGEMMKIAEEKQQKADIPNLQFVQSDVMAPVSGAPFDTVCAFSILHLLQDLDAGLAHLHSMIKPGGMLITKTGCLRDMNFALPFIIKVMQWLGKAPHVGVFNADELQAAFVRAGFEVVEADYHGKTTSTRFIAARRV
ncbi:MAG: class I SAM-dependent methyltransferase [Yoonia sp.]|uniref:class I SAM-dependent methyltransferase n=1 Tax=Yoonia sp. TaxID=2212373 RepID=UPI003EF8C8AA